MNQLGKDFKLKLLKEIKSANLIPEKSVYLEARSEVSELGAIEFGRIESILGENLIKHKKNKLFYPNFEETCIRVLGFGKTLTEFLIAPVNLENKNFSTEVVNLGVLTNFIVGVYDYIADTFRIKGSSILPKWKLKLLSSDNFGVFTNKITFFPSFESKVMSKLVKHNFLCLKQIYAIQKNRDIYDTIKSSIYQMYFAENLTLMKEEELIDDEILKVKSAMPFIIMGLPVWLLKQNVDKIRYKWHLDWMNRFGEFFGWIDDTIDFHDDLSKEHPNRLHNFFKEYNKEKKEKLIKRIVQLGNSVKLEWQQYTKCAEEYPLCIREAFSTCLASWLGGLRVV